ncbi:MAG: hypothetical protein ACI8Q1_003507 [Parvicella sp.]|jgi:hypothetical protein
MKGILASDIQRINKNLKDINIDLDWNHGIGRFDDNNFCIESAGFMISIDLSCLGQSVQLKSSFMEEQEWSKPTFETTIYSFTIWDSEGEKLTMLDKHERSINHNLLKNIYPS